LSWAPARKPSDATPTYGPSRALFELGLAGQEVSRARLLESIQVRSVSGQPGGAMSGTDNPLQPATRLGGSRVNCAQLVQFDYASVGDLNQRVAERLGGHE
jgi:hypothetical protein